MDRGDPHRVRALVASGRKAPDDVVESLLEPAVRGGFVLDGYPRTAQQADRLDRLLAGIGSRLDAAVELVLDEGTLAARMVLRADAEKRSDDMPDVFLRRLEDYRHDIGPIRSHYGDRLVAVGASGSADEVFERLLASLEGHASGRTRHVANV